MYLKVKKEVVEVSLHIDCRVFSIVNSWVKNIR